jgi:imidazolonepropionase-like amidohydrolase
VIRDASEAVAPGFAIRAGGIFDGRDGRSGTAVVEVRNGRVEKVGDAAPAGGIEVLDFGPGSFLVPGLIDTHVHLVFDGGADPVAALDGLDDEQLLERMRQAAFAHLNVGVTSVRDLGDRSFLSTRLASENRTNMAAGPHIVAAGPPITTKKGHCHFLGGEVTGEVGLRAAVRERAARGCGVIKIMVSGGTMTPGSDPVRSQFTLGELKAVVDEADKLGMTVAAHAHGVQAVLDAVRAGVFSIEHATFITPDGSLPPDATIDEVAGSGVVVSVSLGHHPERRAALSGHGQDFIGRYLELSAELQRRGARIVVGSDAGIASVKPHGVLPYAAGELVHELGFSPAAALTALTARAAEACGLTDRKGSVRAGMDADLLVVAGDPLSDPAALLQVRAVFRGGVLVHG